MKYNSPAYTKAPRMSKDCVAACCVIAQPGIYISLPTSRMQICRRDFFSPSILKLLASITQLQTSYLHGKIINTNLFSPQAANRVSSNLFSPQATNRVSSGFYYKLNQHLTNLA
jgi:hypothetical protein